MPRVFLSVSVTAAAQRSGGAGEKDEKRQLDEEEELLVKRKFRKLRSEEAKRERERERTACLNHPTAGTVCAACVQFEHLIETDILHVPPSLCGLPAEL